MNSYSKQIGTVLAETLDEMFLAEDLGLQLDEIRDPSRLQAEIKRMSKSKHPNAAAKLARLQALHDRKVASNKRKAERLKTIKQKQHKIAKSFGYRHTGKGVYVHGETGHQLHLHDDGLWSHLKGGKKRHKQGETPLRALKRHLKGVHEELEFVYTYEDTASDLQEIRAPERLRAEINKLSLVNDPMARQRILRLQQLQRRKMMNMRQHGMLTMSEDEVGGIGYESLADFLYHIHQDEKATLSGNYAGYIQTGEM